MSRAKLFFIVFLAAAITFPSFAHASFNPLSFLFPSPSQIKGAVTSGNMPVPPLPPLSGGMMFGGSGWNVGNYYGTGLPSGSITGIIRNLLMWLLMIFGFLGIIGFVISGIMYILAAGEEGTMEKAKSAMKWSIVGVAVGLLGIVVIQAVTLALNGIAGF